MRSRCSNERGGPYVFTITVLILAVFLLFRLGILLVQKYHDARGAGRSFKRMLKSGALDAQVYEEAVWSEVEHFGKKRLRAKISREQQRIIRAAKTQMRDDFLDDIQPGFYQYIIIFLIASILGLVLEMVWMFAMFGIVESRVGLVWGPFSPLYGFGAVLLTMLLWKLRKKTVVGDLRRVGGHRRPSRAGNGLVHGVLHARGVLELSTLARSYLAMGGLALPCNMGLYRYRVVQGDHAGADLSHRRTYHYKADDRGNFADRVCRRGHSHDAHVLLPRRQATRGRAAQKPLRGLR